MPRTPLTKTVRNERTKLMATTVNTVGIAIFVIGIVVPTIAHLYGGAVITPPNWVTVGLRLSLLGIALNRVADYILKGLVE